MDLIKLNIVGISYSQFKSGAYALFLEEDRGLKKLSIVIGQCEAQAIAIGLDKNIKSPRPLTHDLFLDIAEKSQIILEKIIIHKLVKGIFYSSLVFIDKKTNNNFSIDSRTSDAIAIAIRFNASIYTYKEILDKSQNYLTDSDDSITDVSIEINYEKENNDKSSIESLEQKLVVALKNENYELAAEIRDKINKIKDE